MNKKYFIACSLFLGIMFSATSFVSADTTSSVSNQSVDYPALACSSATGDCSAKVAIGDKFSISLTGNASTGYSWTLNYDTAYLQQDYSNVKSLCTASSAGGSVMVGCGETTTYNFTALKTGTTKITSTYSRPWESVQPAQTKNYNITIASPKVDGACGTSSDLCSTGTASSVTGTGPWTWICTGSNGGIKVSCSSSTNPQVSCIQVITPAKNSTTNECKEFATPCSVPSGWVKVDSCPESTGASDTTNTGTTANTGSQTLGPITIDKPLSQMSTDELLKVLISLIQALLSQKQ